MENKKKKYNYGAIAKAAKPFMTFEQIFGREPIKEQIIDSIKSLNLKKTLILVSQFAAMEKNAAEYLKNSYLGSFSNILGINTEKNKDEVLFASQAILNLYKWLLAYGQESTLNEEIKEEDIFNTINLFLKVSDFLPKHIEPDDFLLQVLSFSKHTNLGNELARAFFIYSELSKQQELYKEKEFLDINSDFVNFYGYSIEQYLAVNFALLTLVLPQRVSFSTTWVKNKNEFFKNTELKHIAPKIIDDLSINITEAQKWASSTIDNSWNYLKLQELPLLKLNSDEFIPFNYDILSNGIFDGLYHRIRGCYPEKDRRFLTFFGRPFEKYIDLILKEAIQNSRFDYEYIEEFDYGTKSPSLSSDFYLRLNEDLIIIEAKGARPTVNSSINADKESIKKDLKKLFIDPIIQADKAYQNILNSSFSNKFKGVQNIYIISVNINNFPSVPSFYEEVDETLKESLSDKVKGYFNFSITDIEAMCYLISRKGKKPPIFKYLKNKFESSDIQSFTWFLEHSNIPIKRGIWINEQLYNSYKKIYEMSFENPEKSLMFLEKKLLKKK
ncbi:hypothetical protein ACIQXF_08385 [Lysinibacillus sp. NPDC097231]|uniref:hypothetical protein n=1 Tax=Lysinibacillus sp. NPDC097231 TaxID=3364142 RepID=UPI00382D866D